MKLSSYGVLFLFLITPFSSHNKEEQGYVFPINPGSQSILSGVMGELRKNHFHAGIDIKTDGTIGIPIYATQKGYVSRVLVSTKGYGNTIYITHPNSQITVYAHLSRFEKNLTAYVRKKQYENTSFEVNLFLKKGEYDVKQGDKIGYSGNSGSSQGPHLHFEIRNSKNQPLNPLLFNFKEIVDDKPPIIHKIALQTMDIDARINHQFGRFEFQVIKKGNDYILTQKITTKGTIGIELLAYDRLNYSKSRCGISRIETRAMNKKIFNQHIDKIDFSSTRNILTLINFKTYKDQGEKFNKLFIDDGNTLDYYEDIEGKGLITVKKEEMPIEIIVEDAYKNQSTIHFTLHPSPTEMPSVFIPKNTPNYEHHGNIIKLTSKEKYKKSALLYYQGRYQSIMPSYADASQHVFLIDLTHILPDSIRIGKKTTFFNLKAIIPPNVEYEYTDHPEATVHFYTHTLYDTVFLKIDYTDKQGKELFSIGDPSYPVHKKMRITLKPKNTYSAKAAVYQIKNDGYEYVGGTWDDTGKITFSSREFATYTIITDSQPPRIVKIQSDSQQIQFNIEDTLAGIKKYEATINGEWLLMHYSIKKNMLWSDPLDKTRLLQGNLRIIVEDQVGNQSIYNQLL